MVPQISPDGKWIVYQGDGFAFKMSLASGEVTKLDPKWGRFRPSLPMAVGSHSKRGMTTSSCPRRWKGATRYLPFITEPQAPHPIMDFNSSFPLRWTADSNAITYVRTKNGASNVWIQPLDGSPAKQLTHFASMFIWRHAWSRDGKYLVLSRGNLSRDAVLLTELR